MNRRSFFTAIAAFIILFSLVSGCAGVGRINSFIANGEFMQHAKVIDFGLFFVIFFSLSYLGFTQVWGKGFGKPGEGKGAIVALSFALALALAFAIVSQTSFSITTIFPLAKAIFFIVIFFLLWGLIIKSGVFGDHWGGKIAAAVLAGMLAYLLFSIATHMLCQMSDNMDDPACGSDFFNAFFTLGGRGIDYVSQSTGWGGGSSGGTSGGTSGGGLGSGGGADTVTPDQTAPTGPIQGDCRLDITFQVDSISVTSGAPIASYLAKVKAMGKSSVNVYGFASEEGGTTYNYQLSTRRTSAIKNMMKIADPSIIAWTKPLGETTKFDSKREPNRRVVLSTSKISGSSFLPAPAAGVIYGCEEAEDGTKDDGSGDGMSISPWWLIVPLLLLLLLFGVKRKSRINIEDVLVMKDVFLKKIDPTVIGSIPKQKERVIMDLTAVDPTTMTADHVQDKAQVLIDSLNKELTDNNWKPMRILAQDYAKYLDRIVIESRAFRINEQHAKMIVKLLKALHKKYSPSDKWFAKKWEEAVFNSRLKEVTAENMHGNKIMKELHEFLVLQMHLKKAVKEFSDKEKKVLVKLRKMDYSTFLGTRSFLTRHIERKKGAPWLTMKDEVEGKLEEHFADPSSRYGIVEVTQEVRNLCQELLTKIQEVMDEEENVSHHASTRSEFFKRYEEETALIKKLVDAIKVEKEILSEEWRPVIDHIGPVEGKMEGHIHYRRY
ncbi:MAG: hypothetical protein V1729_03720 [Candidatus Woesearchaeota archaeon]